MFAVKKRHFLLFFIFGSFLAHGQETNGDVHARLLQGKKRSLIVYSEPGLAFTIPLTAHVVKPSDIPGFISIDRQILQTTIMPAGEHVDPDNLSRNKEKTLLTHYMSYELDYYRHKLKQRYTQLQTSWVILQGRLFLLWYFDIPKDYKLVSRQLYLSALLGDHVVDLNAPIFKPADFTRAKTLLMALAGSLKVYDHPLDEGALARGLDK